MGLPEGTELILASCEVVSSMAEIVDQFEFDRGFAAACGSDPVKHKQWLDMIENKKKLIVQVFGPAVEVYRKRTNALEAENRSES